jgi:hypothetical protein
MGRSLACTHAAREPEPAPAPAPAPYLDGVGCLCRCHPLVIELVPFVVGMVFAKHEIMTCNHNHHHSHGHTCECGVDEQVSHTLLDLCVRTTWKPPCHEQPQEDRKAAPSPRTRYPAYRWARTALTTTSMHQDRLQGVQRRLGTIRVLSEQEWRQVQDGWVFETVVDLPEGVGRIRSGSQYEAEEEEEEEEEEKEDWIEDRKNGNDNNKKMDKIDRKRNQKRRRQVDMITTNHHATACASNNNSQYGGSLD